MNLAASESGHQAFSEYVDPEFRPIAFSPEKQELWSILYGATKIPEKNVRTDLFLRLIENALLDEYVTWYDPRITYSLIHDRTPELLDVYQVIPVASLVDASLAWASRHEAYLNALFSQASEHLASVFQTYSDADVRFAALLLIVFGVTK